ncbi:glutamate--tRNA ligase [Coemansia thaxteri]|nr:glutamate--tRNA ligase [Coemansia thaxteri]
MALLTLAQKGAPPPYIAAALAELANEAAPESFSVEWMEGATLRDGDSAATTVLAKPDGAAEAVGEAAVVDVILGSIADAEIAQWVDFARTRLAGVGFKDLEAALDVLEQRLQMRSFVCGHAATAADAACWGALRASAMFQRNLKTKPDSLGRSIVRWYAHATSLPFATRVGAGAAHAQRQANCGARDQGSFDLGLTGIEHGRVAALLNEYVAHSNGGRMLVRFDDTNPDKERSEFEDAIVEDLALLGIRGDSVSHTSDHFQTLHDYAVRLIERGLAYVDDTPQEDMRHERWHAIASRCRDLSVADNLARFDEMRRATPLGLTCCLRAKMSVDNVNKALRDPVLYRCNLTPHHRTGTQWKIYPTYDFCCPIIDSLEGVTHALRSMEYRDRNPQYTWFFDALDLRPVQIMDFSRLNFAFTLLSKRKLQWFVDSNHVTGWDDPRFPTVRGIRRRGMTIEALRQYVLMQGASQRNMLLDWDKIWALNKKAIDPVAPRHTALLKKELVPVSLPNGPASAEIRDMPRHKKSPELGTKRTVFSSQLFVDQEDAALFEVGEELTLMDWGNAVVEAVERTADGATVTGATLRLHLEGDVKATKRKITWLGQDPAVHPVEALLLDYDYLITKRKPEEEDSIEDLLTPVTEFVDAALVDANVAELQVGAIIQLERRGYFIVDKVASQSELGAINLIRIPDGTAATVAIKHNVASTPSVASKSSTAAANPWDKKKAPAAICSKPAMPANQSSDALGLPSQGQVSDMYGTKLVYGDMGLEHPSSVCDMYVTKNIY